MNEKKKKEKKNIYVYIYMNIIPRTDRNVFSLGTRLYGERLGGEMEKRNKKGYR